MLYNSSGGLRNESHRAHIFYLEGNTTTKIGFRHVSTLRKSVKCKEEKLTLLHIY